MSSDYPHQQLTKTIIGGAMNVLNEIKPGLDEKLYENALFIELEHLGLSIEQQKRFPVYYRQKLIGTLIPDLIVSEEVIVDTKVVTAFSPDHVAQMLGYLAITGLEIALILNFKNSTLGIKRVVRSQPSA